MQSTEAISSGAISAEMLPRNDRRKRRGRSVRTSSTLAQNPISSPNPTAGNDWPDAPIEDLDLVVLGDDDEEFVVGLNDSKYVKHGNIIFCTIEITFTVPTGQSLEVFAGLPYAVLWPSLGAIGFIFRASTAERDLVCVRPLLAEPGRFEIWYPDQTGTKYVVPADDETYGLNLQFFYFTDGQVLGALWQAVIESTILYRANIDSGTLYQSEL